MSDATDPPPAHDTPRTPRLPEVQSPERDDLLDEVPSKEDVVEQAQSVDDVIAEQPSVDEILRRDGA